MIDRLKQFIGEFKSDLGTHPQLRDILYRYPFLTMQNNRFFVDPMRVDDFRQLAVLISYLTPYATFGATEILHYVYTPQSQSSFKDEDEALMYALEQSGKLELPVFSANLDYLWGTPGFVRQMESVPWEIVGI